MSNDVLFLRFLRPLKEYDPPIDIKNIIIKISNNTINQTKESYKLDKNEKISLLKKCDEITDHKVPNSLLHTVNTLGKFKYKLSLMLNQLYLLIYLFLFAYL